jgi:hypothetical protein
MSKKLPLYNLHQSHGTSSYVPISVSTLCWSSSVHVLLLMLRFQTSHLCEAPINL